MPKRIRILACTFALGVAMLLLGALGATAAQAVPGGGGGGTPSPSPSPSCHYGHHCKPKPTPTPKAPVSTVRRLRSRPKAPMATVKPRKRIR